MADKMTSQAAAAQNRAQSGGGLWKRGSANVPGRPKLKTGSAKGKSSDADSFQNFTESVNDAWDIGDDEFCTLSASAGDMIISPREVQTAAMSVLETHKQSSKLKGNKNTCTDQGKAEALQRLAAMKDAVTRGQHHNSAVPSSTGHVIHPKHYPGYPRLVGRSPSAGGAVRRHNSESESTSEVARVQKFHSVLFGSGPAVNMEELKKLSWSGVPGTLRPAIWRLLSDYLPPNRDRWEAVSKKKREEYWNYVSNYYKTRHDDVNSETYRQIHIDIPRMAPLMPLFQQPAVQEILERILFIWAIRHPASGYVQGINDLVTPFFVVFLTEHVTCGEQLTGDNPPKVETVVTADALRSIEADTFWGFSHLLSGIQDHYTFAQPGIQKRIHQLADLVQRVDATLHAHIARHDIDYLQFAFRWMNNLLTRELSLPCTLRLWDTCLVEPQGFGLFYLYICAAFLCHWREELLKQTDFQSLMLLLQNLPTKDWTPKEIGVLAAEAYKLKYVFDGAPNHLSSPVVNK